MPVGLGWDRSTRTRLVANPGENFEHCKFTLAFSFEEVLQKFPRVFTNPSEPDFKLINYADFGLLQRSDVVYPDMTVQTKFSCLDYNFFSEQYVKVNAFVFLDR